MFFFTFHGMHISGIRDRQDQIVAIVNARNKVKILTREQLLEIHSGKITKWKEIGGSDYPIVVVIPAQNSGTRQVTPDSLMDGAVFVANAYVTVTDREALDIVAKSSIAIALLSEGFAGERQGAESCEHSAPKRQRCIITKNEQTVGLKRAIEFLQSKEGKRLFK